MVASQNFLATEIGVDILRRGGNAIDAGVAVGLALAVTLPRAGNVGGGGFILLHLAEEDRTVVVDFRETAPAAAHADMFFGRTARSTTTNTASATSRRRFPRRWPGSITCCATTAP